MSYFIKIVTKEREEKPHPGKTDPHNQSGFLRMKSTRSITTPPWWDASPSQVTQQSVAGTYLYSWAQRSTVRGKCLTQEYNAVTQARARTLTGVLDTESNALTWLGYYVSQNWRMTLRQIMKTKKKKKNFQQAHVYFIIYFFITGFHHAKN